MFSNEELETLYYACAQAEMMWRHRSNSNDEKYTEDECRDEMKRYRQMHRNLEVLCEEAGIWNDTPSPAVVNRPNQRWISTLPKV